MNQAGDYKLDRIILHSVSGSLDIKELMVELNIYESIHANSLYGNIVIADVANHIQNMPIIGQEELEFTLSTDDSRTNEKIDFTKFRARIYKVSDQVRSAERQQVYTLSFTTKEAMTNQRMKLKSAYSGSSDYITFEILQNMLRTEKDIIREYSSLYCKVLGNMMSPFSFIEQILTKRSASRDFRNSAGFLFFENHRGYNFRSFSHLTHRNPETERLPQENFISQPSKRDSSIAEDMQNILEYRITKNQDVLAAMNTGLLASTQYIYDVYTKSFETKRNNYLDNFIESVHTRPGRNAGTLYTKTPEETNKTLFDYNDANITVSTKDIGLHTQSTTDTRTYDNHSNLLQERRYNKLRYDQLSAKVTVFGNSNLAAGDIVTLRLPSYEPLDKTTTRIHDTFLSGRWLITNVVHTVNTTRYTTTFDCVRDSVEKPYKSISNTIQQESDI